MDPSRKQPIIITVPEDAQVLTAPVGVASDLQCLATEEDQAKLNELKAEVKELAEKRDIYKLLREQCEEEVKSLRAELYKLLSEQREEEVKSLWAELDVAKKEHAELVEQVNIFEVNDDELDIVTNVHTPQVQQKVDKIYQLRAEMEEVKALAEECKGKMDRLASKKETAREQLALVEVQLRMAREKVEARAQRIKDLQSQLDSAITERDALGKELET
uniref:Myosin-11-like n=1 Tax=Nicotiana tabacum TaxID=4097 RepID=A0A1S3ZLU4_TOBAC|nr:PREDICTED: myosin-11-like [Nicotiana tabacum]